MLVRNLLSIMLAAAAMLACTTAGGACRKITSLDGIEIDAAATQDLKTLQIGRAELLSAIQDVSKPETQGCWSGAAGNFDDQLVSVGFSQWNFGQGSLQPLLSAFRRKFDQRTFDARLIALAPQHGRLLFSEGCTRKRVTSECRERLLALQSGGRLIPEFENEVNALFEDDAMIQVQVDRFVRLLTSVRTDLQRLFPGKSPTPRQVKWAIDTKVQQGSFPALSEDQQRIAHCAPLLER